MRLIAGITLEALLDRIEEETGRRYTRGALSAIENGHRGASAELISAIEAAYGLPRGAIDTEYKPRHEASRRTA
ncbi:helix-turn-helix domain-containing protein [Nocardia wallacei]|uniref:helix-turn-helix domain-containing protein n=1 Tax=Nocardia wallacei TaxID=480035 RepID=UPI002453C64E|nr:helix-turn-helix transcriptional regulator [Nocardia wallacei]